MTKVGQRETQPVQRILSDELLDLKSLYDICALQHLRHVHIRGLFESLSGHAQQRLVPLERVRGRSDARNLNVEHLLGDFNPLISYNEPAHGRVETLITMLQMRWREPAPLELCRTP